MIWIFLIVPLGLTAAKTYVGPEYLQELRDAGKDEEFAKLLGLDVKLVRSNNEERSDGSLFRASPLGDILLSKEQEEQARQGIRFDKYPGSRWPNGQMPYKIANDYNAQQTAVIENAIAAWNEEVYNLQLVPRRSFWFPQRDYVLVFSGDGCYSYLGKTGGQQALSLQANGCVSQGTVQHEFMHAAGFAHEHNRADRDDYITLKPENIPPEWLDQYKKVDEEDFVNVGPYDYYSIMHYPVNAPGTDLPAYEVLQPGIDEDSIGNGNELTQLDIDKLNTLYS